MCLMEPFFLARRLFVFLDLKKLLVFQLIKDYPAYLEQGSITCSQKTPA
jgi:hypothetical protein